MAHDLPIQEFKMIITDLADRYPRARVDFVYPKHRAGKRTSQLGQMTQFSILRGSPGMEILRFIIDYAREPGAETTDQLK